MDKPKLGNKPYKKIVPLKGKFLAKLKNEIRKESSKNGKQKSMYKLNFNKHLRANFLDQKSSENGGIDTINNNVETIAIPTVKEPLKSPENKIIIQKVENVKIEMVKTNPKGPPRRISSLFLTIESNEIKPTVAGTPREIHVTDDAITEAIAEKPLAVIDTASEHPNSSIKLLSAKMPENSFNQAVPLKMVRLIKQQKPKPNLRQRFHRVETFKPPETLPVPILETHDFASLDQIEVLMPDIEMHEGNIQEMPVVKKELDSIKNIQQTVDGNVRSKGQSSESEEDFYGYSESSSMSNMDKTPLYWYELLKKAPPIQSSVDDASMNLEKSYKSPMQSPQKTIPTVKPIKIPKKPSISMPSASVSKLKIDEVKGISKQSKREEPTVELLKESQENASNVAPCKTQTKEKPVALIPVLEVVTPLKMISSPAKVPTTSKYVYEPFISTTSQETFKRETGAFVKMNKSGWQNDIIAVIGASRLKEIDETLKDIPNIITGNAVETEIVELKLIINHLLRKLKANSIMETAEADTSDVPKGMKR